VLSSDSPQVVATSIRVLAQHSRVLDLFGLPVSAWTAMTIHGGKSNRADKMVEVIGTLPDNIRNRLVLENDEYAYGATEILDICQRAGVPMVFLGKPYTEQDPYFQEFRALIDNRNVRYAGFVSAEEKFHWLRGARGFALLSQFETGCIALLEAAAAGLPLFLSRLPWATRVYSETREVEFVNLDAAEAIAPQLRVFHARAHRAPRQTFPLLSWREVAVQYCDLYQTLLSSVGVVP